MTTQPHIGHEPGWLGAFSRDQAPGAYPNGSRVVKAREEEGDVTPIGTCGTVLGSVDASLVEALGPDGTRIWFAYFVEWDNRPRVAIGVLDWKLARPG